jgi:hypothetical protein
MLSSICILVSIRRDRRTDKEIVMDRTFLKATVVFAALAIAGVALTLFPAGVVADSAVIRALGPALLGAGLAAFLVQAFNQDRREERR